jgi:hypothetical protein
LFASWIQRRREGDRWQAQGQTASDGRLINPADRPRTGA